MVEKMEGFPESIKFLHQNWRQDIPVLLDLIYTDEKYRSGIELFLENYLNYYVVNNENDAIKAIRLLFSNSKGKANFFILDKFRNSVSSQREIPACVSALSVIEVSNLYQPLFNDLLKDVYILDKEEHLEDVIQFPDDISIISLSGSIIKSNKIITGGSIGLFEGKKLGRKKNLEKLEIEIKNLEGQTIELERQLSEQKNVLRSIELTEKTKEIEGLRKSESELLQHRAQIKAKLQHLLDSRSELENRIKINVSRIEEIKSRMVITSGNILELKTKQAELQNSLTNSDEEYNVLSVELSEASNVYHQAKLELLKWQNKLDNIQKELDYKNGQLNEIRAQLDSDYQKCDQLKDSIQLLSQSIEKNQDELLEKLDFRKNMDVNLSAIEQEYYEMRNSIAEFEARVKSHQKNIYDYQSIINQIKETKAEYKFRIQSAQEIARIEFSMDLEHFVPDEKELEVELDSLEEKTRYYKTRIDNYGEVNPLALEAYEEMKGRLEKIEEQRNDILKAQDSLLETIKEIEDTATAGFLEAFNQVRHHFQAVFRSLFTEDDDCDLILVDESDPLECDIDIIAKPKGKRPKSISQLSGGEKTLTAIALLFSLYLLKPAPFCIFDEVDAPLDDINIEKFNKIIRKFAKDSQFIIITHNKLTMADVDVLYGVYMEEQGLSSVTAVDLRKYEHEVILEEMAN
jgi:chromosome segregation protein